MSRPLILCPKTFGLLLLGLSAIAACGPVRQSTLPQVGLANPASIYCAQQGGRVEVVRTERGEVGYCRLPTGQIVEEQAFYRQNAGVSDL